MDFITLTEELIRRLFKLSCTPFTLTEFRKRWHEYGWRHEPSASDRYGFQVEVPEGITFQVDPLGAEIVGASFPFCYWEDYDPDFHKDRGEYERQKCAYDAQFEAAAGLCQRILSAPFITRTDPDKDAHRAIAWEGSHGILILQQACFDPQFGIEVNFWLSSCSRGEFRPEGTLIGWLCQRSQRLHEQNGHPA